MSIKIENLDYDDLSDNERLGLSDNGCGKELAMNIVAYGGGTNSTAMLIECVKRQIPIDLILFADTGGEKPHTYKYVEMFSKWLVDHGMPEIITVGPIFPRQIADGTLENECLRLGVLPTKAYGFGACSMKWKREPQDRYVKNWEPAKNEWAAGRKVTKLIGMDADEPQRGERLLALDEPKYSYRCPLMEWEMGRDECLESIKDAGLCSPGKSACFFCPSSRPSEIRELAVVYPDLADRAIALERNAADYNNKIAGLGRQYSWETLLKTDDMFADQYCNTLEMDCGCYDG